MIDSIGPSRHRYRKKLDKIRKEKIKQLTYAELIKIKKGKLIPVKIPIIKIPRIKYGPWIYGVGSGKGEEGGPVFPNEGEEAGGAGQDPANAIYGEEIGKTELINWLASQLELEFMKPAKSQTEKKLKYPSMSNRGNESLIDLDETVDAWFERQIIEGNLKNGKLKNKIKIEEDDLKYKFPKEVLKEKYNAAVFFIRDISGSIIPEELEASHDLSLLIQIWLEEFYSSVEKIFIPHNAEAWEENESDYYKLESNGGTIFSSAYSIIDAMLHKKDYPRKTPVKRSFDSSSIDIYVLQMSDGENWDREEAVNNLENLMPHLTRFCYLEQSQLYQPSQSSFDFLPSGFSQIINQRFPEEISEGKIRIAQINEREEIWDAMRIFFGKKSE